MITRCLSCEQSATRYEQQRAFSTQAMNTKENGETKKKKKKKKIKHYVLFFRRCIDIYTQTQKIIEILPKV